MTESYAKRVIISPVQLIQCIANQALTALLLHSMFAHFATHHAQCDIITDALNQKRRLQLTPVHITVVLNTGHQQVVTVGRFNTMCWKAKAAESKLI